MTLSVHSSADTRIRRRCSKKLLPGEESLGGGQGARLSRGLGRGRAEVTGSTKGAQLHCVICLVSDFSLVPGALHAAISYHFRPVLHLLLLLLLLKQWLARPLLAVCSCSGRETVLLIILGISSARSSGGAESCRVIASGCREAECKAFESKICCSVGAR